MSRSLFDALAQLHRYDDLEEMLDFVAEAVREASDWATVLVTFYFERDVVYGAAGCPPGTKARFRDSYLQSTPERRARKRAELLRFRRPGTNICFLPAGAGPRPASAYLPGTDGAGTWRADDRLLITMRDWNEDILGILSLDGPGSGNRPDEAAFARLEEVDRFANIAAKIAESRFWSLRVQESEQAYRGIFDAATDAMFISNAEGTILEVNAAACRLFGYAYEELVSRPGIEVIHPDDRATYLRALGPIRRGLVLQTEGRGLRKDGTAFDVEVRATAFQYRGQRCLLAVLQDLTDRKQMMAHLLARQKDEGVVTIAGGVAHDFNNLLQGITGSVSLLDATVVTEPAARAHLERIAAAADRLTGLTGQLLAVARGVHSEPKPTALGTLIEENLALVRGLVESRFHLVVEIDADLWPVQADRVQIGQVLLNLSRNACEAMAPGGTLRIRAENEHRAKAWTCPRTGLHPPGDYVRLVVEDDGHGVDAATMEHLFEPYFSTKPEGSGLGLAAVLGIVRRHHGSVGLDSRPEGGTRIEIHLPRCHAPVPRAVPETPSAPVAVSSRRVLLVDDHETVREVASAMLQALGCEVDAAGSGEEALRMFEAQGGRYDLVLLDVSMPGLTGLETHERLRALRPDVRVLLSSGHAEGLVREDADAGGPIAGFIQKPYNLDRLRAALDEALRA